MLLQLPGAQSQDYTEQVSDVLALLRGTYTSPAGYAPWVRSIRSGEGAIAFPTPAQARAHTWTAADRELVADRVDTQFVAPRARSPASSGSSGTPPARTS